MKKILFSTVSIIAGCAFLALFSQSLHASSDFEIAPLPSSGLVQGESKVITIPDSSKPDDNPSNTAIRDGYSLVCENANLVLYFENSEAGIAIKNKKDGSVWYSIPEGAENDPLADGSTIMSMCSHLIVDFVDEKNNAFKANSMVSSVRRETFKVENDKNGMTITFDFSRESEQFSIPVRYALEGDCFKATILYDEINEYGKYKITNISLLPYFGAGEIDEDGYMLIPDGSGALVDFKDKFNTGSEYYEYVYGRDPALSYSKDIGARETIRLPVFGITKKGSSFVGVISQGDAAAGIVCRPVGLVSSYGAVFPCFTYRQLDITVIADKSWKAREVKVLDSKRVTQSPVVRYYFTGNDGYSGMANRVRQYLIETYKMKPAGNTETLVFLQLYGAVKKTQSIGGIVRTKTLPVTTFSQAEDLVEYLNDNDVEDVGIILNGFNKGGMYQYVTETLNFDSVLGNKKEAESFIKAAQSRAYKVYFTGQIMNLYKPQKLLRSFNAAARTINGDVLKLFKYKLSTGMKDSEEKPWYLLHYNRVASVAESLRKSVEKTSLDGLMMPELSSLIYSDYDNTLRKDRTQAEQVIVNILQELSNSSKELVLSGGNMYSLPYTNVVLNAPMTDSKFRIVSQPVPFYQMVCHGLVAISGDPINSYVDTRKALLLSLEGGMLPSYVVIGTNPAALQNTKLENLYYANPDMVLKLIIDQYKEISNVYAKINNAFIIRHEIISEELRITFFDNGKCLAVNYGDAPVKYRDFLIPAKGFQIFDGT